MEFLLNITTSALDAFILTVYLTRVLGKMRPGAFQKAYLPVLLLIESVLYADQLWTSSYPDSLMIQIIVLAFSFFTTFLASFFFEASLQSRFLASIVFQLLYIASESIFTLLILKFQPNLIQVSDTNMVYAAMSFGTIITMFFLTLFLSLAIPENRRRYPLQFNASLLIIPLITFIILSLLQVHSFYETQHINTYLFLVILLSVTNVVNYIQIMWSAELISDRDQLKEMQLQFTYQKQKYDQLSESYRSGRRFLHDTKNHLFIMQEYLENKQYDQLTAYIRETFGNLENLYARYNTGNLVIDSLLTNCDDIARQNNIRFEAVLRIDKNRIPLEDYDLCIILGNILDNALNACKMAYKKNPLIRIVLETTGKDLFLIEEENTMDNRIKVPESINRIEHGYGLKNIERTVEKYHGIMGYQTVETFHIFIRVPITAPEKRCLKQ